MDSVQGWCKPLGNEQRKEAWCSHLQLTQTFVLGAGRAGQHRVLAYVVSSLASRSERKRGDGKRRLVERKGKEKKRKRRVGGWMQGWMEAGRDGDREGGREGGCRKAVLEQKRFHPAGSFPYFPNFVSGNLQEHLQPPSVPCPSLSTPDSSDKCYIIELILGLG